jgi:hypothetical protein
MPTLNLEKYYWSFSSIIVLFCCIFLFWLDHETKFASDFVQPGYLVVLLIYFIPAFLLSGFLFYLFNQINSKRSFALAHLIGIPAAFAFVIRILTWNM